jgi:hypothetical protein
MQIQDQQRNRKVQNIKNNTATRHQDLSGSAKYAYIHWWRRSRRNSLSKGGVQSVVQIKPLKPKSPNTPNLTNIQKRIKYRRENIL